jgi:hypothetical protein
VVQQGQRPPLDAETFDRAAMTVSAMGVAMVDEHLAELGS